MNTLRPNPSSQTITKVHGNGVLAFPPKGRNFAAPLWWEGEFAASTTFRFRSVFAIIHSFLATARHVCKKR
jgi:hypothetical protein